MARLEAKYQSDERKELQKLVSIIAAQNSTITRMTQRLEALDIKVKQKEILEEINTKMFVFIVPQVDWVIV